MGIFVARVNCGFAPESTQPIDGLLTFSKSSLRQLAHPHDDTLVLTVEVGRHLMKHILVDLGSASDLLYLPALVRLDYKLDNLRNLGRFLVRFNGTKTHSLGEIVLPILVGPVTLYPTYDDRRAIKFQRHIELYLNPCNEGTALFLPSDVEFLNSARTGRHQWRPTSNLGLLCD